MADAAISFAVERLGDALIHKVNFLKGVEKNVRWVKDELESMKCFLRDAAEKQGHDERIRRWISDVREVAQDAEDVIETFTLKVETPRRRKRDLMRKWAGFPAHLSLLNRVGNEIESIRSRLDEIGRRRERYGIGNLGEVRMESKKHGMVEWRRRMAARYVKDKDVVGLNEDVDVLLKKVILDEKKKGLSFAAVVGMGGIGKSTLARKIYNHPAVAARFEHRAWVVVSSEFSAQDIIKQILQQLPFSMDSDQLKGDTRRAEEVVQEMQRKHMDRLKEVESVEEKMRRQEMLQEMLRQRLEGQSYFIVLDDVWEDTDLEALKTAFPDEQDKASRLLFTSRNQIIREHHGYIHKMRLLNPDESWELLLKTAFVDGITRCPPELEDVGRQILNKCHGLPLAITIAGGLLVNQEGYSRSGWEKVLKKIKNYHLDTSEIGTNISAVLEVSYHNLASQLKPCFLCLGFFKEDAVIRAKRLVHIWVALGFVQVPEDGEETEEEIAASYLDELIKRNLIQVREMTMDDRAKYCYVHDLLRELSIRKAKEEIGFRNLISEDDGSSSSSSKSSSHKPRHCVVRTQLMTESESSNRNRGLRSLFIHVNDPISVHFGTPSYWKSFELLRILDIEGGRLPRLPSTICELIGLRYLRLREVGVLPSWLDALKNLEVVDIADSQSVEFPDATWKMDSLRHLYIDSGCLAIPDSMKRSSWKNLETLKYMQASDVLPMKMFSDRLRKVGLDMVSLEMDGIRLREKEIWGLLAESHIRVLHLRLGGNNSHDFRFPNSLTKLKLEGRIYQCPELPQNITHLTLSKSRIKDNDPMEELGKLPQLTFLKLDHALGNTMHSMEVPKEGFPRLQVVHLTRMPLLRDVKIGKGGMPELQRMQIYKCPRLLETVHKLQEHLKSAAITIMDD